MKMMTVTELKEKIQKKEKIVIVDCREPYEWNQGHIPKSILIAYTKIQSEFKKAGPPKEEIVIYCQSGTRSISACFTFLQNGYDKVCHLEGGLDKWIASSGEIVREKK